MEESCVLKHIPHRYPLVMVDAIAKDDIGYYGIKNVTYNEWYFQGNVCEPIVMPPVMILEAMAQTAGLTTFMDAADDVKGAVWLLGMSRVRFQKEVHVGQRLIMRPEVLWVREETAAVYVRAMAEGEIAVDGQFIIKNA